MDNRKYIAIKPTTLSTGVNVGDTTCIPSQIKDRLGNSITAMTSFGTKGFGVISPDTDKEEQFVFTGLSGGTVSGISAVTMQDPHTETSGWLKEHSAGEPIILYTNSPAFYNDFANVQNDNTYVGIQTYPETAMPRISAAHTYGVGEEEFIATKRYVDGVVTGGAADANTTTKGLVEEATQAEIAAGTAAGGTSARLFTNPSTLAAHAQAGTWIYFVEDGTGSDDTYTATLTPTLAAYTAGMLLVGKFTVANTGAATLNLDSLGAKALKKYVAGAIADVETGDIVANQPVLLEYDGMDFVVLNPSASIPTTANLVLVTTNIVNLTDGSSASGKHFHTKKAIIAVRAANAAAGDQVIAHGLSVAPKYVEIFASVRGADTTSGLANTAWSRGFSDGSNHSAIYQSSDANGGSTATMNAVATTATRVVYMGFDSNATTANATQEATAAFDGTNITLTWTTTGTLSMATEIKLFIVAHT